VRATVISRRPTFTAVLLLAFASVWWLGRPTTDPRLVGKWLQPAGAVFELRADGTGTFHYPTVRRAVL
jgi:hypothetical protein